MDVDGRLLDLAAADPGTNTVSETARTEPTGPSAGCAVARFAYRSDGAAGAYDVLSPRAGSLGPFDAVWVRAFRKEVELRIAMPGAERTTR